MASAVMTRVSPPGASPAVQVLGSNTGRCRPSLHGSHVTRTGSPTATDTASQLTTFDITRMVRSLSLSPASTSTSATAYGTLSAIVGLAGRCCTLTACTTPSPDDGRHVSESGDRQVGHTSRG